MRRDIYVSLIGGERCYVDEIMEENIDYPEWQTVHRRTRYGEYQVEKGNAIKFIFYFVNLFNSKTIICVRYL